ncbi:hypothetical protein PV08_02791 [Exophiala spinifera]|uniref:Choline transport protein n=1 Tax=Exophiala spinifera TaxID=91928 RepID=A0A0D2BHX0_9EURO|nr:uncharacterized protein PV08_02791 [Exophiala spinifera]KIW18503.1 hypothetical protein PV08_02791 [Exophiala spinifera]
MGTAVKNALDKPRPESLVAEESPATSEGHMRRMDVTFSLWSTLGLVYSVTATPIAIGAYLSFSLVLGGSPFYLYGYIFAVTFNIVLCVALAEVSSLYPHPSGHIYWVGKLSPEKWSLFLSYWTGAFTSAAWFFWTSGTYLLTAQILSAAIQVLYPTVTPAAWHVVLMAWAQALVSVAWNIPFFKTWPYALKTMIFITNAGALFIAISLLVRANPKQSARSVFVDVANTSGWTSNGVVFFLGLLPGATSINGFDSAAHMVEEMPDPVRQVPQVMVGNALLSGFLGLPMIIVLCFCITNLDNLLAPVGGVTLIQLFNDSLDSEPLFIVCSLFCILATVIAATACTTTCSRVWWSFAEHQGLPFSSWFAVIHRTKLWTVPVNATLTTMVLSCLIILLNLGPSFVLGALFTAADVCFYMSYFITLGCFLHRKWSQGVPAHYFDLRFLSNTVAITGAVWAVFVSVWLVFPYYRPVTSGNMNYAVAIIGTVVAIFTVDWLVRARKSYLIPSPILL